MSKSILFVVEGRVDEPRILNKVLNAFSFFDHEIVCFEGSIYELYTLLKKDEYLDLKLVLKERLRDTSNQNKLSKIYSDIYLVFDFDPHYHLFSKEKIAELEAFFCDSLNQGKLLINYPMMQSFKHLKGFDDSIFLHRKVSCDVLSNYKHIVSTETTFADTKRYTIEVMLKLIWKHYEKAVFLITGNLEEVRIHSDYTDFLDIGLRTILNLQLTLLEDNHVMVLNTSLFCIFDIAPKTVNRLLAEYHCL